MEEGRVGYSKGLVMEFIRLTKAFKGTIHVVPFLPPPLGGTNDPELIRAMLDILAWLEKLQKWDMGGYLNSYRAQIYATGGGTEQTGQNTQRHKMPKTYDAYNDKVFICHPWTGIGSSLPAMDTDAERVMVFELLECLAKCFKWDLDCKPVVERELSGGPRAGPVEGRAPSEFFLIGGSNCQNLYTAVADLGASVESLSSPGWVLCPKAVDATVANLGNLLHTIDKSIPIVIWGLDNSCFRAVNADGDMSRISKSPIDKKFHVIGELAVTPFVLLKPAINELRRLLELLKDREVWILDVLPRFLLLPCCDDVGHCVNTRQPGPAGVEAGRRVLEELADLNAQLAAHLSAPKVKFIATGDLLTGVTDASMGTLMDTLFETWSKDPVHGEKRAYTKIGLALLHFLDKKKRGASVTQSRKRTRDGDSPAGGEDRQENRGRDRERTGNRREAGLSAPPAPMRSAYVTYPGDFERRRESPAGRRGGPRRDW
jgi:hypothetical protein